MDPFEYFIGLYTIIVGLGIALLVRSVGQMIEGAGRVRLYWVHAGWLVLIFFAHVASWFFLWKYHGAAEWRVLESLLLLLVPIFLYLASHLAVPEIDESDAERHDLEAYYFHKGRYRWIQGLVAASIVATFLADALLLEDVDTLQADANRLIALAVIAPGLASPRRGIHAMQMVVLLALVLVASALGLGARIG